MLRKLLCVAPSLFLLVGAVGANAIPPGSQPTSNLLPVPCYPQATDASVRACFTSAQTSGNAMVIYMPASPVTLTAALPVVQNVDVECVAPQIKDVSGSSLVDDWNFVGGAGNGTIFQGNGSFPAFQGQKTAKGSWDNAFISGFQLNNCGFFNVSRAIDVGNTNAAGLAYPVLKNLYINTVQDGFYLSNMVLPVIEGIWVHITSNSCGQIVGDAPTQQFEPGNMKFGAMMCNPGNTLTTHGWLVTTTAGSVMGTLNFRLLQVDAIGGSSHGESVVVTSGTAALPVAHLEDYPVGAIVQVTGTTVGSGASALTSGRFYAVLSQSGASGAGTITVALGRNQTTITPNGSGAITLTNLGWPLLDVWGGGTSGSFTGSLTGSYFGGIDLEGNNTQPLIYAENAGTSYFQFNAGAGNQAVFRNSNNARLDSTQIPFNVDADNFYWYNGFIGTLAGSPAKGVNCSSPLTVCGVGLGDTNSSAPSGYSLYLSNPGGPLIQDFTPLASPVRQDGNTGTTQNAGACYVASFTGSAGQSTTLPALTTTTGSNYTGCYGRFVNNESSVGALTVNANTGQTFNKVSSPTAINVPWHGRVDFQALADTTNWVVTQPLVIGTTLTVAQLPTCTTAMEGMRQEVSDASSPTWNAALTGGGSTHVTAKCNGSAWVGG